jgi:hypothetical protein
MARSRPAVELAMSDEDIAKLVTISRSRTEPASRLERAQMLLAYRERPSFFTVGACFGLWSVDGARRPTTTGQGADDHAGSQSLAGVAGLPQGEGAWLSARVVDDLPLLRRRGCAGRKQRQNGSERRQDGMLAQRGLSNRARA